MILFPRWHLFEIGDQSWCPEWMRTYIQSYLTRVWNLHLPPFSKTSPAGVAANLILENLSDASSYTFVELCAGAGGPTGTIEKIMNSKLQTEGKQPAQFVLTDLYPCVEEWTAISKRQEHVSFIAEPIDATSCDRIAPKDRKECRIFNLSFHHFDDPLASTALRKAMESADSFIICEMSQRNLTSLLNIPVMFLFPYWHSIAKYRNSPLHLFFTYVIPLLPFLTAFDGLVSTIRCRTGEEIQDLLHQKGLDLSGWKFKSGNQMVYEPFVHMYYFIAVKDES
ncbi:uncharacterized protein N7484_007055 [Penicillium longicatenatum]|uniref:uncharacterized protein n=1 Tax=Penicillium longicatenatum TaxID=1561947 RepID=UPI0025467023|nr:uncharacterized protein N7484_007055 [Penicillium longicatenatum]KAJ5639193.1 hypothetical protein N7484_007055 [Penicillium longicatenatum]